MILVPSAVSNLAQVQVGVTFVLLERIKIKQAKLVVLCVKMERTKTRQEVLNADNVRWMVMKTIVWNATNVYHNHTGG